MCSSDLAAHDVRILAPIPGRSAIGVEVPNQERPVITLGDILTSPEAKQAEHPLQVGMGRDIAGKAVMANLAEFPHVLIAGQTGAGKSSCINSIVTSLLVRTTPLDQVKRRTDGLSVLLVDIKQSLGKGLTIRPIETMVNHQTNEVFYDNLRVPVENLVGEEGKGFRYILDGMNSERILVAHESVGDARFFINKAVAYAKERVVFGRPIGQNQGIQFPLARAYSEYRAADLMVRAGAALFQAGKNCGEEANLARLQSSEASWTAAEACLQTHGGFGFAREYDVERKFRETRLYQVAPINNNLVLAHVASHVLGLPKSY